MDAEDRQILVAALDPLVDDALRHYQLGEHPVVLEPYMEPREDGVMHSSVVGFDAALLTRRCMGNEQVLIAANATKVLAAIAGTTWVDELAERAPERFPGSRAFESFLGIATQIIEECAAGAPRGVVTDAAILRFEHFCAMTEIKWVVRAPLAGVAVVGGPHTVTDYVALRMADNDFKKALWATHGPGANYWSTFADDEAMSVANLDAVIETTLTTERDGWPSSAEATNRIEAALTALRVHGAQRIAIAARWTQGPSEIKGFTRAPLSWLSRDRAPFPPRSSEALTVNTDRARDLRHWIARFDRRPSDDALSFAIQRFNLGDERVNDDDRLVDVWIALESLFSKPDERDEITYRIALRLATLLGESQTQRKAMWDLAKLSYGLRSSIVHGTPPAKRKSKHEPVTKITNDTEELLRRTFRKWVESEYGEPKDVIARLEDHLLSGAPLPPSAVPGSACHGH